MTEQEAEAFMQRMERVWITESSVAVDNELLLNNYSDAVWKIESSVAIVSRANLYLFFHYLAEDIFAQVVVRHLEVEAHLYWTRMDIEMSYYSGKVHCYWTFPEGTYEPENPVEKFAQQWTDTFRRGCWLSGCDIEASAHEKAEWIQGFTREEIEAWNLKF